MSDLCYSPSASDSYPSRSDSLFIYRERIAKKKRRRKGREKKKEEKKKTGKRQTAEDRRKGVVDRTGVTNNWTGG